MSDCEYVPELNLLNCDNFMLTEEITNESSSDILQGPKQSKQLEYIYQVQEFLDNNITLTSQSKSNQYVETIIYEATDSSDDDSQLDCNADQLDLLKLNGFNKNFSNESLPVITTSMCNPPSKLMWENYIGMESTNLYDKYVVHNKDIKDTYVKQKIQSLGNEMFDKYFHTCQLDKSIAHFNTKDLCFEACNKNLDQIDRIIKCVNSTIEQLKRISEGEYLSNETREIWRDAKVLAQEGVFMNSDCNNNALHSSSVPIHLCANMCNSLISIQDKCNQSNCEIFENKVTIDIPKVLDHTFKLFDNRRLNPRVLVPVVSGKVTELSVTFNLRLSFSGNFISCIKSIMVLPSNGHNRNLAGHTKNRDIVSIPKLSAPSLTIIDIQTKNEAYQSQNCQKRGELCTIKCENNSNGQNENEFDDLYISKWDKGVDDLLANDFPTKSATVETKLKHNHSLEDIMSSAHIFHRIVSEKSISHILIGDSENEIVYTNDYKSNYQSATTTHIMSLMNFEDDDLQNHITDKHENSHEDLSTCNSERHMSDDNSLVSSNTTISLLDVLGRVSSNNHQFKSTPIPVIDDLKVIMKTLSIQSCLMEDSDEAQSSDQNIQSDTHITNVDKQDENPLKRTMKSTKKLLEIRERRKLKSVIEVKRKGSNSFKRRGFLAASASNSTTGLSITNKSFYDSIYGINMSVDTMKNAKLKSPTRNKIVSKDVTSSENELGLKKSNETIVDSCDIIDNILNEMGYEHTQYGATIRKDPFRKDNITSKTVQSINSMISTESTANNEKYTAVPYTLSGPEIMQPSVPRNQNHYKDIKTVKSPSQNDWSYGNDSKLKKLSKKLQKIPVAQNEADLRCSAENKQRKIETPGKSSINSESSSKAPKTTRAQIKCKKSIDKIYNLMRRIDNEYNMYKPAVRTTHNSLRTIKENSSQMEINKHLCCPHPHLTVTSSSSSNDGIERYAHKNYTLKVPKIIINAKTQSGKTDLRKVTEKLPTQYHSNYTQLATKSIVRKSESNFEKSKVYTDPYTLSGKETKQMYDATRHFHKEQCSETKKNIKSRDSQKRVPRFEDNINIKRSNNISSVTPGETKKKSHPSFSENTKFTLVDKHAQELHRRVMDLRDEEREARGEAVRGPPRMLSNYKDYIKRLDTLAQPKRAYVQAHCEEFKHKLAPVMSNRLAKIISLSHNKTRKPTIKQRTVAGVESLSRVKDLGTKPQHNGGRAHVKERRTRSSCSLTSHARSTLSHFSLSPKRHNERTKVSSPPVNSNFETQIKNGDLQLKSLISFEPHEPRVSFKSEVNLDLSKNSCLTKSDNFLSDSNFHVFNECIHEFLNKVLLTVIPQAEQTDVAPNDGSTSFKKIAKVHNGIVMIDSCELFDLNYGQTVDPFQTRQSMIQSFNIGTNVEETTIIPNNLPRPADNLTPNNNSTFVLRDCNSQAFIKYIPTVMSRDNGLIKIKKRLQLANLTNLSEQASKTILLLQAGDMSRMSAKVTESAHKYIQPSTSLFCLDNSLDQYHWTSFENFYLSRMPLVTVGHNISSKNIQSKKLIYLSHILNIPSIVHIATVWHRCIKYEMIKNHSNTTSTAHGMHNWMDKKQTESFVKVLDILTELQGISNGLMQVVTIVGFQHIYHPVYVITQHCSYFYHISSFNYVNYYETIKLREDDYSKCLAPYGSFYSIYASDCGDLICSKHANIGDGIYVANNNTISNFKRSGVEYSNFGINMCNICTSIQTLQTVSSNSILSSRTSSSTALTKNKKRITIFCHKQPVIRSSGCTVTRFSNMAGDSKLPINIHYPIELKDISTSSVSIQRLDIETKIKRNVLFTMYIALVVIIFSMLSMPQILVNLLY